MIRLSVVLALSFLVSSCATLFSGGRDTVTVNSMEPGTSIFIDGVLRGRDTASADVKRGKKHTIRVEKAGFQPVTVETSESFDGLSLLGIFIDFGIITIPIDLLAGGAWKTEPTMYTVTPLLPAKPATEAADAGVLSP